MTLLTRHAARYVEQKQPGLSLAYFSKAYDLIKPGEEKEFEALRKQYSAALIAQSITAEPHVRAGLLRKAREVDPYLQQGEGLVGGMKWQFSTYALSQRPGLSEEVRKKTQETLRKNFEQAGVSREQYENLKNYDFLIGLAASNSITGDILRAFKDNLSSGRGTAASQQEYNSLRGRSFDVLNCHSNGAMICLTALEKGDIDAKAVRLVGPEITAESLREWNDLLKSGKIANLQFIINSHDPVPVVSFGAGQFKVTSLPAMPLTLALVGDTNIEQEIKKRVPGAETTMAACSPPAETKDSDRMFYCHDIVSYRDYLPRSGAQPPTER